MKTNVSTGKRILTVWFLIVLFLALFARRADAQACDSLTPVFNIDLSSNPDSVWTSPPVVRDGKCCGVTGTARCIEFNVTLSTNAERIKLDIISGATPGGSLDFQLSCGGSYPFGQPICMSGPGPHRITFCKPGNNTNVYQITSLPKPSVSDSLLISSACTGNLYVLGLVEDSITWGSVPSNPTYDSYLTCTTGCDTVDVIPTGSYPNYVDYKVCGPLLGGCASTPYFCDTLRVYLVRTLDVEINPDSPIVCFGDTSALMTAIPLGGLAPFNFTWSTGDTGSILYGGQGTYSVAMTDFLGCETVYDTVTVGAFTLPIQANAGPDITLCRNFPVVTLNGSVQIAQGGRWIGGGGVFSPDDSVLVTNYYPTLAQLGSSSFDIQLITTGNYTCPADTDIVTVNVFDNPVPFIFGPDTVCENKVYSYNTGPSALDLLGWTTSTATFLSDTTNDTLLVQFNTLGLNRISLTRTNAQGCDSTVNFDVFVLPTPKPEIIGIDSICEYSSTTYTLNASSPLNTYNWSVFGGTIVGPNNSNQVTIFWNSNPAGQISLTETNSEGCDTTITFNVAILPRNVVDITGEDSTCNNKIYTYTVPSAAGYTYQWSVNGGIALSGNTDTSYTVLWNSLGSREVSIVTTNNYGCDTAYSFQVEVLATPEPVITGDDSTCSYKIYAYNITPIAGSTYNWSVNGGSIIGSNSGSSINVIWGAAGAGTVQVTQTSAFGCDSTVLDSIVIMPTPEPVIVGEDSTCSYKIYAYNITPIAGSTYNWSVNGGSIIGSNSGSSINVIWGAAGAGTVQVTQTSAFGCDSTVLDSIVIMPTPEPVIVGEDSTCSYKIYAYNITPIAGSSYNWSVNGGSIIGSNSGSSINVIWGAAGAGTVQVTQTSAFGCDSTVLDSIVIMPTPEPVITGEDSTCSYKIYAYNITPIAGSSYNWSVNGGSIIGSNSGSSINVIWGAAGAGTVQVTQTSAFGCDSTVLDSIVIMPTPEPVITGEDSTCSYKIYAYYITPIAGSTYNWSVNGGSIIGSNSGSSINVIWGAAGAGTVQVTQTSAFGCDSTVLDSIVIMPTPEPVVTGEDSTCSFKIYTYQVNPILGSTYNWAVNGGTILGANNDTAIQVIWGAAGNGLITLTQTSAFGCDSTVLDSVVIMPTPEPVITGEDSTCSYKIYAYNITPIAGSTYNWSVNGGNIIGSNSGSSINVIWGAAGAGTVQVTQTSAFGCDSTVLDSIVIMPTPEPVIVGEDSTCSYKIYAYNITPIAGSTYNWSVNGGSIIGSNSGSSINVIWGAAGAGTVQVTQTSAFGCDSTVLDSIVIMPTPEPVIVGEDSTCSYKIYAYNITPIAGSTYNWSVNGGSIIGSNSGSSINVIWGAAGAGTVQVTQTSAFGCDSTVLDSILIMPTPEPVIVGEDSTCSYKIYTYQVNPILGSTYNWSVNGGTILGANNDTAIQVIWGAAGNGLITLTQTSDFGCDSIVTFNVLILPTPEPIIVGPDSTCSYKIYSYNITPIAGSTYNWSVNGGSIIGSNSGSSINVIWGAAGAGTVQVTQTSAFGCDSSVLDSIVIMPTPEPVITGEDSTCSYKIYTYQVNPILGSTYNWSVNGGTILGANNDTAIQVIWGAAGNGLITLTQTSDFGCDSTVTFNVLILPTPEPIIVGPDSTCSYKIYAYNITPIAGSTYNWSVNGGSIIGSNSGSSINVIWGAAGAGTVQVTQTSSFGCDSTVLDSIVIMPTPEPVITGEDSTCSYKIYAYNITPIAGSTYNWSVNGGNIIGSNSGSSINVIWGAAGAGTVQVTQTSAFGCDSTVLDSIVIMPTPEPVIVGEDSTCSYKIYAYNITPIAGSTYNWSVNGGSIIGSNSGSSINVIWGAAGAGTVQVTQTSAFGCDSTVLDSIVIMPTPEPVITGEDSTCSYKIYAYNITPIAGSTYNWSVNGGSIIGSNSGSSINVIWGAAGAGTVQVTQTSAFGCDSTVLDSIVIMPTPEPVITGEDSTCSYKIYAYNITPIAGSSYNWSVNGGSIIGSNSGSSINVIWGAAGAGTVQVTQTSAFGCDSTVLDSIVIMPTPEPVIVGEDSTCSYKIYTYQVNPILGSTYNWAVNGGTILGANNDTAIQVIWGAAGNGLITLTQTSDFGCDSTVTFNVLILPTPEPIIVGPDSTCSYKIYAYNITPIAGSTYNWSVNGGSIIGSNSGSSINVIWGAAGAGTVQVTQTSAFGCDSTVLDSIVIMPTPEPVIVGEDSTCSYKIYAYNITPIAGSTYNWSVNGGSIIGSNSGSSINVIWGAAGAGTVQVTQTSAFGCDSTVLDSIVIMPTPEPVIVGEDSTCSYKIYTYQVNPILGSTYNWAVNGGTILGANNDTAIQVIWGAAGNGLITLTQTSDFGCDSIVTFNVLILPTPEPIIVGPDSTCSYKIYAYNITPIAGSSYNWSVNGGSIIGSNSGSSINVIWGSAGAGTVQVTQTSAFGCDSTVLDSIVIMPTPEPVITGEDSTCSYKIYAYNITPIAGSTYNWSVNGGNIIGSNSGSSINVIWGAAGAGTVQVTQTSAFGCDSTVLDSIVIMPTPEPVIVGEDSTCSYKIYTYQVNPILGSTYNWAVNGGTILGANNDTAIQVIWGAAGAGTVQVTQTSAFGCDSTVLDSIVIMPTPEPVITGEDSTCSYKIYAYNITPIAGSTYNWSVNGGNIIGSNSGSSINVIWGAAGAGTVQVTQTSAFGCDSTVLDSIVIMPTPEPVIVGEDSTCSYKIYTYQVNPILGSTYNWSVNGGTILGANNDTAIQVIWGAAGNGLITLTQTSDFGCDSIVTFNVLILPTPEPIIVGPDSTCSYKIYSYNITPIAGSTYNWSVNGGSIIGSNSGSSINVIWGAAGAGTVQVTQTSAFGCDSSVLDSIVIMPTPEPVITGEDSTCSYKIYTYQVNPILGSTYNWSVNGGTILGANNDTAIQVIWGAAGNGLITLTQTSDFGCDSTVTFNVLILPTPEPIIVGPDSTCSYKIYAYNITPIAGSTYNWSVNGGNIIGSNSGSSINVIWGAAGAGTVQVTQTSAFGCDSTVLDSIVIMPTPEPVIVGEDSTCSYKIYTYQVNPILGSSYNWAVNGGTILGANNDTAIQVIWGAAGNGLITLTQTSDFGCDSTVTFNVLILPTPEPIIVGPDSTCSYKIYAYNITPIAGSSYNWSVNGGSIIGSNSGSSINVIWGAAGAGTVQVTQTSAFGCDSTVLDSIVIMPTPEPVIVGEDSTCSYKIYAYNITPIAGSTYNWSVNGGNIIGSNSGSSINVIWGAAGAGTVQVTQTSAFGCDSTVLDSIVIMPTPEPVIVGEDSTCSYKIYTYQVNPILGSTYNWAVNGGTILGANNDTAIQVIWGAAGNGLITLTQTSDFGCDSIVTFNVLILPTPEPIIVGPDSTCSYKIYAYNITPIVGSTYNWSVNGGSIIGSNSGSSINVIWGAAGAGTVQVTQTSAFGCDSTVLDSIVIMPTPEPVIVGEDSTCSYKIYTYQVNPILGSTYNWAVNGGTILGANNDTAIQVIWGAAGNGLITLTQTSDFGCDSTVTFNVLILPTPEPIIVGPDSTCSYKIYAYNITPIAGSSYNWSVNGGSIIGSNSGSSINVIWGAAGAGTVQVTQTSAFGCDSTVLDSIVIMPTPEPVIVGEDSTCSYKIYAYNITPIAGSTYNWSVNGGNIIGSNSGSSINVIWGAAGAGTVQVTQTSAFGCDSTVLDSIVIMPTPEPVIVGEDSTCSYKIYTYQVNPILGSTYNWAVNGGTILGANNDTAIQVIWGAAGNGLITLTQTSDFGCDSIVTFNVLILPTPEPIIVGPDSTCSYKIYAYNITPIVGSTYNWSVNGGSIIGSNSGSSINVIWGAAGAGTVQVTQTSAFGCDSTVLDSIVIMPTPEPVIVGEDSTCSYKIYTYQVNPILGSTYNWAVNGGTILGANNDTAIQVIWGAAGNGLITLTQTSDFGCDSTVTFNVLILPTPEPIIVGQDSTCSNKIYTYSVIAVTGSTYNWIVTGGTILGSSTNSSINVIWGAPGNGLITLTQTSNFGCDSTTSIGIRISPSPVPQIVGPSLTCENDINIVYAYAGAGAGTMQYQWTVTNGTILGPINRDSVYIIWNGPGIGTISLFQINSFGCDSSVQATVTITPSPRPTITGSNLVCQDDIAQYSTNLNAGSTYIWRIIGGEILGDSTTSIVNVVWRNAGIGFIEVTETNNSGCDSTFSIPVNVNPAPTPIITGPNSVCALDIYTYSANNLIGHTYNWQITGGVITNQFANNIIEVQWGSALAGNIRLQITSPLGCDSTIDFPVIINSLPVQQIQGNVFACANTASNNNAFNNQTYSVPNNPAFAYNWSAQGGNVISGANTNSAEISWYNIGQNLVFLQITNTLTGCVYIDTFAITADTMPTPQIQASNVSGCVPLVVNFNGSPAAGNYSYEWYFPHDNTTYKTANTSKNFNSVGSHTIRLIVENSFGCRDTVFANIDALNKPNADFVIIDPDNIYVDEDTAYFRNTSSGETTWEWTFHDYSQQFTENSNYYYTIPGFFPVTLRVRNDIGCEDSITKYVQIKVIPLVYIPNALTPNGDRSNEYFTISTYYVKSMEFIVFNRWGEIIYRTTDLNFKWDGTYDNVPVQQDVYAYFFRGIGFNNELIVRKGNISVLR